MSATMSPSSSPTPTLRRATRPRRSIVDYGVLPAVVDPASAAEPGQPQIHDVAPDNTVFNWHLGDKAATDAAFAAAAHVTKLDLVNNRLIPNAMEPRAAVGDYDSGTDTHDALHDEPEPARRAARAVGVHRPRARAQAARHRARRRRRLRLEDLHLRRGDGLRLGGQEDRPAGQMDGRPHRGVPLRRARPRPRHPRRTRARRRAARSPACACTRSPTSAPISRPSRRRCRPTSTRRCCRASTTSRRSTPRSTRSTPTPRRSTPIAAPDARRRPSSSSGSSRSRRARPGAIRPNSAAQNFVTVVPASDAGHHGL